MAPSLRPSMPAATAFLLSLKEVHQKNDGMYDVNFKKSK